MTPFLNISRKRAALAPLLGLILAATALPAGTGPRYPSGPDYIDPVTGYLCVTPFCDVLRLPGSNCICQKENPGERRLSRLRLTCSTQEAGAWVACPVKSPYGITVD
jgi:hypothetical protein